MGTGFLVLKGPNEAGELWVRLVVASVPQVAPGSQKMAPEIHGAKFGGFWRL